MGDDKEHERSIKTEKEIMNSFQDQKGIYYPQTGKVQKIIQSIPPR